MDRLRIDSAHSADLERYIDMLEEIQDWLAKRGLTPLPAGLHRDSADYYAESIRRGEVYFAFVGDDTVGSLRLLTEDSIAWPEANDNSLYLHSVVVLRGWSGRKIGQRMLKWAEERTKLVGKDFLRLDCFAANPVLRTYYESAGYKDRGEIDARFPFGTLRLRRFEKTIL